MSQSVGGSINLPQAKQMTAVLIRFMGVFLSTVSQGFSVDFHI